MSVWKKATKANQRVHRERHQPEARKHLGFLEKKKDYRRRADNFNRKKETLKVLHKKALTRNPDEFYHHMINSKVEDGVHIEKRKVEEHTPDQLKLMRTQDLKYIRYMRDKERKKIERLQSQLHLIADSDTKKNKHIRYKKYSEREASSSNDGPISELPDFDVNGLKKAAGECASLYKELSKRIVREKELTITQQKVEVKRHIESKKHEIKPKRVKRESKESAAVYLWKYERKR